ncbi:hypothetical protein P7K49_027409, partial [Saguinus oedipus]
SLAGGGSSVLLLAAELLPGEEEAMVLRVTRNSKINAESMVKISMAGAKRLPMALATTSKPGLRPKKLLGTLVTKSVNISKRTMRKEAKPSATGKVIAKKLSKPVEKVPMLVSVPVSQPVPGPEPEPVKEE